MGGVIVIERALANQARKEKRIREAIVTGKKVRIVFKSGDMPHAVFLLKALIELEFVVLDESSRNNIDIVTRYFRYNYPQRYRTFVITFSPFLTIEKVITDLAQAAKRVNLISSDG